MDLSTHDFGRRWTNIQFLALDFDTKLNPMHRWITIKIEESILQLLTYTVKVWLELRSKASVCFAVCFPSHFRCCKPQIRTIALWCKCRIRSVDRVPLCVRTVWHHWGRTGFVPFRFFFPADAILFDCCKFSNELLDPHWAGHFEFLLVQQHCYAIALRAILFIIVAIHGDRTYRTFLNPIHPKCSVKINSL